MSNVFFFNYLRGYSFFKYMIPGLFSGFFSWVHPEHRLKYLRVYSEPCFNDDSVFCFVVRDSIGILFWNFTKKPEFETSYFGGLYLFLDWWHIIFDYIFGIMIQDISLNTCTVFRGKKKLTTQKLTTWLSLLLLLTFILGIAYFDTKFFPVFVSYFMKYFLNYKIVYILRISSLSSTKWWYTLNSIFL